MNKIFLTQDGEVLRVQKRGQILLTLTAKDNGNSAVLKRWDDVEDLRVTSTIPNVSGAVRLPHSFNGSDLTIASAKDWQNCKVMVIGNLGGVPFEYNVELHVADDAAETTTAIVEIPALDAGGTGGGGGGGMIEITHADLVALRDAGQLVAGQQYRITDYVATTIDPESRSANHPFDIIVTADDERTLNESARAIAHDGDTYFEKCNLAAWRLQYCIDNNQERFAWAQQANDGYQIYVQDLGTYVTATLVSSEDTTYDGFPYRFTVKYESQSIGIWSQALSGSGVLIRVSIAEGIPLHADINHVVTEDGKGVIYRMIDENNNDMPYDFKGIQFKRYKITDCEKSPSLIGHWAAAQKSDDIEIDFDDFRWAYLFNVMMDDLNEDDSVGFYLGTPKDCKQVFFGYLPNGVCMQDANGNSCYSWTCGDNCNSWTCGNSCSYWTCGNDCDSWTCGNSCSYWTCGNSCSSWTCGNDCDSWTCGNNCNSWTCGNSCSSWTCGDSCDSWTCGDSCYSWTCGNNCYGWTCGNSCSYWTCGNSCSSWTCGNSCSYWTCGNSCSSWTCGDSCYSWTCGNDCDSWTCGNNCNSWTCGNSCSSWTCGDSCYSWTCGDSCYSWTCGNNCYGWTCGNSCSYWTCGNSCSSWTCGNDCDSWTCGDSCDYFKILNGTNFDSDTTIPFVSSVSYCQFAGLNSNGALKVWTPADLV